MKRIGILTLALLCAILIVPVSQADEGMWPYNNVPLKTLEDKYHFQPSPSWLAHLQKASVRFDNGGSGSFVSADGLVMTNHHVGADCLQNISTKDKDYLTIGFEAHTYAEEPKCNDLELDVLMSIEDVSSRVKGAVTPGMTPAASDSARRAVINTIEKESQDQTGLRSDVITLYNGGQYDLYRYKRYTDVRLVFAPEMSIAFFGGDPDNFEYPRYDLDICFFRVYENDKPVHVDDYLQWSANGAADGELVFVSGNPGSTARQDTIAQLEYQRDVALPSALNLLRRQEVLLQTFSERSAENERRAQDELFGIQNSRKALTGMLAGLQDPAVMKKKLDEEQSLKEAVKNDPKLRLADGGGWDEVAASLKTAVALRDQYNLIAYGPAKGAQAFNSRLFGIAMRLVRMGEELPKPNPQRLREYSDASLPALKLALFSPAPIYNDLEIVRLADSLGLMMETLGANNPLVLKVLAGKSPRDRATELIQGTRLGDVAVRKQLADGGSKAIEASSDPMIQLARLVDPDSRRIRAEWEQEVDEPQREGYSKIANARFALYDSTIYPDATFTLRLSFGEVKAYTEEGKEIPWDTTLGGAYMHADDHGDEAPFALPNTWRDRKSQLNLSTPFNFVSTADIIGGNSGSPVVNRAGELVGIIFDGDIQSLVLDYIYTDAQARAVAVHSAGILEALRKIYGANRVVNEITGKE